jgi:oligopeptide/dipeptide ABC transporter ATP-binding protein
VVDASSPAPAFAVERLKREFGRDASFLGGASTKVVALDDVSFEIARGESLGVVGESGSGKTTLGRILVGFERPSAGRVLFDGKDMAALDRRERTEFRRQVQMVFQNPFSALNPRRTIRSSLSSGLAGRQARKDEGRLTALLHDVGLNATMLDRYPHEFSGGQRQRIVLARALAVNPSVLIADEPVSALDVSVQAQVLNLLARLRAERRLTVVMITHDLRVANFFCNRVAVLYRGRLVEIGPRETIMERAWHPYTRMLMAAALSGVPGARRTRSLVQGEIGDSSAEAGCVFRPRCWLYQKMGHPGACEQAQPALRELGGGEAAACHFVEAVPSQGVAPTADDRGMEARSGKAPAGPAAGVLMARP